MIETYTEARERLMQVRKLILSDYLEVDQSTGEVIDAAGRDEWDALHEVIGFLAEKAFDDWEDTVGTK